MIDKVNKFIPFETTGIGSLPFKDACEAVNFVLQYCDIPFWPQLPLRSPREQMLSQYMEGFPGLIEKNGSLICQPRQENLNHFYESYSLGEDFPISKSYAEGFYQFIEKLKGKKFRILKGQVTGPVTFTLGIKLSDGRFLWTDEELREIGLMLLKKKAIWQIKQLKKYADNVCIFIDEPSLSAIGSSTYLIVQQQEVQRLLSELANTIKSEGAIAGIHCCGRADWQMVLHTGIDLLSFDAYEYFDSLQIYASELKEFLLAGGIIAWGIVPTTDAIKSENPETLLLKLKNLMKQLNISDEILFNNSILTPSCGAGSRSIDETKKVFNILKYISDYITD